MKKVKALYSDHCYDGIFIISLIWNVFLCEGHTPSLHTCVLLLLYFLFYGGNKILKEKLMKSTQHVY